MALYNTHRPQDLDEVHGNDGVIDALRTAIEEDNLPHTILLSGGSGMGKTTIARILADYVSGPDDTRELNISNTRGIDMARRICEMVRFKPLRSGARVIVLNECHKATNEFQNAMLEVLEEPPNHTYFILCTTEPDKLLKTVRNRCVEYKVKPLPYQEMSTLIEGVAEEEEAEVGKRIVRKIAQASDGSPRQALTILEQVIGLEEDAQEEAIASYKAMEEFDVPSVCRLILRQGHSKWKDIAGPLKSFNGDAENVRRAMLGYFTAVLLNPKSTQSHDIACFAITALEKNFFDSGKAGLVAALYMIMHPD